MESRHLICKEASLEMTYLIANIMGEEPRISVFSIHYKKCMGF